MQKASATKSTSDQFAKVFAQNAAAHDRSDIGKEISKHQDITKRSDLPIHREPALPHQHAYRLGVDDYRKTAPSSQFNKPYPEPLPQTKNSGLAGSQFDDADNSQKTTEQKGNLALKKSSPVTENPDLEDLADSTKNLADSTKNNDIGNFAPILLQPLPVLITGEAATLENAQLALAAAAASGLSKLEGVGTTWEDVPDMDGKVLAGLKNASLNNSAGLLLQAFSNTDENHSSDKLLNDLLSLQPQILNTSDKALNASLKGLFDKTLSTDFKTQQMLGKFEMSLPTDDKNIKSLLPQLGDILKTNLTTNTDLMLAPPLGSAFGTALEAVNNATNNIKEASLAASSATLASLPVSIASRALKGAREFTIHLHPAELGRVDVKMEINDKGEIKAHLRVERPETLALLQRDSSSLNRSLEQAGFKPGTNSLEFSLHQDSSHQRHSQPNWAHNKNTDQIRHNEPDHTRQTVDITAAVMNAYARRNNGAVDIHI